MLCPNCGGDNRDDYRFCIHCGSPRQPAAGGAGTVLVPDYSSQPPQQSAAYTPPPATPAYNPPMVPSPGPEKKGLLANRSILIALVVIIIAGCLLVVAAGGFYAWQKGLLSFGGGGSEILLGFPNNSGEADLYHMRLGQEQDRGTLLTENALQAEGYFWIRQGDYYRQIGNSAYNYGGFIPGQSSLLYWYTDDSDEISLNRIALNADTPTTLLSANSSYLWGQVLENGRDLFISEPRDSENRCYFSKDSVEADRIARGEYCALTYDRAYAYNSERDGNDLTLTIMRPDGSDAVTILDQVSGVSDYYVSSDGSRVLYLSTEDEPTMYLLNGRNGDTITEGDPLYNISDYGLAYKANIGYYLGENEDGDMELYIIDDNGTTLVASGLGLGAMLSDDGRSLVYMTTDDNGEETLYTYNVSNGESTEISSGDGLTFNLAQDLGLIFIADQVDDELTLSSVRLDGSNLVTLFTETNSYLGSLFYVKNKPGLYLTTSNDNGQSSLFYTSSDREDGFYLVEDFADITVMDVSPSGGDLLFVGREDYSDDPTLYTIPLQSGADMVDLDNDADYFSNGVYSANGKQVVYTAVTGSGGNDVEVRQVNITGKDASEMLYDKAFLVDVQWTEMLPFLYTYFNDVQQGSSFCPGAPIITIGDTLNGNMNNGQFCYRLRASENQIITFRAESDDDTTLTLYDRDGYQLSYDDDSGGNLNPRLAYTFSNSGTYYIQVNSYTGSTTGSFTLSMVEGVTDPAFSNAIPLQPNVRTRGAITSSNSLTLETFGYSTYGVIYSFEGQAGQFVQIDVFAESLGSNIDPMAYLFDPAMTLLTQDDDSGSGYDSMITYTLPSNGRYYILVEDLAGNYGDPSSYNFEILLTK